MARHCPHNSFLLLFCISETYVAFFNLNKENATISANVRDLSVVHGGGKLSSCTGTETWSGRTINTKDTFSAEVVGHGCALFVLNCH